MMGDTGQRRDWADDASLELQPASDRVNVAHADEHSEGQGQGLGTRLSEETEREKAPLQSPPADENRPPGLVTQLLAGVLSLDEATAPGVAGSSGLAGALGDTADLAELLGGLGLGDEVAEKGGKRDARVGLVYDPVMEQHVGGPDHFERPERTAALIAKLEEEGLSARCTRLRPRWATDEELLRSHTKEHIEKVDSLGAQPSGPADELGDMFCSEGTPAAARTAAGCVVEAVQRVARGEVQSAMAVVRPPGHHAECSRAMGFCFFNNVAVAAQAALEEPGVDRVLVLDWDVHHGNGIQNILEGSPDIMYVSLHRGNGFFPMTGEADEVGTGAGAGYTVNIPWPKPGFGDLDYAAAFDIIIEPVVASFMPDLVIIAAGFDAVEGDPLGKMRLTQEGYGHMTHRLMKFAGGRVVAALEGGYNVRATAECAAETVRVLLEGTPADMPAASNRNRLKHETKDILKHVAKCHEKHWDVLAGPGFQRRHKEYFSAKGTGAAGRQQRQAGSSAGIEIYV